MVRSCAAACAAVVGLSGCGGAAPAPREAETPPASDSPAETVDVGDPGAPTPWPETDTRAAPASATPAREPVPASSSLPAGIETWTDAERNAMHEACKPLMDAIVKVADRDRQRRDRTEAALHALQESPSVDGIDMDRCSAFVRDELLAYRARSIESEAIINIKRIVVGLADASRDEPPRLCPSAPPVPSDLEAVRGAPHQVPPSAWGAEGWRCVRFQLGGAPQRFQYELVTDPQAGTYRIIARGFPVLGHGPEELFLAGETADGRVTPSSEIMRK